MVLYIVVWLLSTQIRMDGLSATYIHVESDMNEYAWWFPSISELYSMLDTVCYTCDVLSRAAPLSGTPDD